MSRLAQINSLWRVPLILSATGILAAVSVLMSVVDGSGRLQHGCARLWAKFVLLAARVRVRVEGLDRIDGSRGYIFMANHLSMFDHWAFLAWLPFQFRFAAKASLFRIPLLGWHLSRSGNIPVDLRRPRQTLGRLRAVAPKIERGLSLVIYPEGGRTFGDKLAPFKRGAFLLAKQARAPVVPVTILGAHRRLARGSVIIYPGTMELIIHPAIEPGLFERMTLQEMSDQVRQVIQSRYSQVDP